MLSPLINKQTALDLIQSAQSRALEVSQGKLSDFSVASPVTAIFEAIAVMGTQILEYVDTLATSIENNRVAILGISRLEAREAVGTIQVDLDAVYNSPFYLPRGFRVLVDGIAFETIVDLTIAPYVSTGVVAIAALEGGVQGNLPNTATIGYESVEKIASIKLTESTRGGQDEESLEQWKGRIYSAVRRRDTLLSEDDFEQEVKDILGIGSSALALGRLKPDLATYDNGYVAVFGLNPDGSSLNEAQMSQLEEYLNRKAAMANVFVTSMEIFDLNISVIANFESASSADSLALEIRDRIDAYLKPGNLEPGKPILNKAIEFRINQVTGITDGVVAVKLNGLAQPQSLPAIWSVARWAQIAITLTPESSGTASNYLYTR